MPILTSNARKALLATIAACTTLAQAQTATVAPVGQAPEGADRPSEVATIFEQPGVLTPAGRYVLEPSLQYGYASSNRVALVGYTIIPALLVGLVDVREVKRNTVTAALAARFGLTPRFEVELRAPYVYRSDATISRDIANPSSSDTVFSANGMAMGDLEIGARYQLNDGGIDRPFYVGTLRFKSHSGNRLHPELRQQYRGLGSATGPSHRLGLQLVAGRTHGALPLGPSSVFREPDLYPQLQARQHQPQGAQWPGGVPGHHRTRASARIQLRHGAGPE